VKLRTPLTLRDHPRNGNKRPHSLVSVSSSSSSSASSGLAVGGLMTTSFQHGHPSPAAAGLATAPAPPTTQLGVALTTMHESPLEMASPGAGPAVDQHGMFTSVARLDSENRGAVLLMHHGQ